jgi:hypothetical protein
MRTVFLLSTTFCLLFLMLMAFRSTGRSMAIGMDIPASLHNTGGTYTRQIRMGWPGDGTMVCGQSMTAHAFTAPRPLTILPLTEAHTDAVPRTGFGFGGSHSPYATWISVPAFVPPILLNVLLMLLPWKTARKGERKSIQKSAWV